MLNNRNQYYFRLKFQGLYPNENGILPSSEEKGLFERLPPMDGRPEKRLFSSDENFILIHDKEITHLKTDPYKKGFHV